jgi:hypothetical protein
VNEEKIMCPVCLHPSVLPVPLAHVNGETYLFCTECVPDTLTCVKCGKVMLLGSFMCGGHEKPQCSKCFNWSKR